MQPTDRLYEIASAAVVGIAAHWPGDATPLPDRQLVSNGLIVWDCCEQLAVEVERTFGYEGDLGAELQGVSLGMGYAMRGVVLAVWLLRQVADLGYEGETVTTPSVAEIQADAAVVLADATAMFNALLLAQKAGELADCQGLAFQDWTAQGPESGIGGGVLRVKASLL